MAELPAQAQALVVWRMLIQQLRQDAPVATDQDVDADECFVGKPEPPVLPPDPFQFDGVMRKGLGRLTPSEALDLQRQRWLAQDDEHQRCAADQVRHGDDMMSEISDIATPSLNWRSFEQLE
jgi:hypothetical protein